jgi:hypothetical protein
MYLLTKYVIMDAMSAEASATFQVMSSAIANAPNCGELTAPGALTPRTPGGTVAEPSKVCGALYPLTENRTAPELGTETQLKIQLVSAIWELNVGVDNVVPPRYAVATFPDEWPSNQLVVVLCRMRFNVLAGVYRVMAQTV